ncbi:MAG: SIS domain-containing protein, partial [Planctomycetes bacterium]|nr:SIS domain-containing protein [Planctomycetota bacterium]
VASTKAYTAQVASLFVFALHMAKAKGRLDPAVEAEAIDALIHIPEQVAATLFQSEQAIVEAVDVLAPAQASVFLGRGGEHATALEGALKLKEIAYVHATGYPAGEFKHGPIALVTNQLPVICIAPKDAMHEKMISNLQEVRARNGRIIGVGFSTDTMLADLSDHVFPVAKANIELLQPLLSILPLQRYSYHVALRRDCDVDQPRNLAKSVTVE